MAPTLPLYALFLITCDAVLFYKADENSPCRRIKLEEALKKWEDQALWVGGLNLTSAYHRELVDLPAAIREKLNDDQVRDYLRPGRVPYDDYLLFPPAINFLVRADLHAMRSALGRARDIPLPHSGYTQTVRKYLKYSEGLVHVGPMLESGPKQSEKQEKERNQGWWHFLKDLFSYLWARIQAMFFNMNKGIIILYQRMAPRSNHSLQVLYQSVVSRGPFGVAPMLIRSLAVRNVGLASPRQNIIWREARNRAKLMKLMFLSMAGTRASSVEKEMRHFDPLVEACPIHEHADHSHRRTPSQMDDANDNLKERCNCHYHI
jgi:hypothetical protein